MQALVTGGAGFIGSNIVDALVERGDTVRVLDDLTTGFADNIHMGVAVAELDQGGSCQRFVIHDEQFH